MELNALKLFQPGAINKEKRRILSSPICLQNPLKIIDKRLVFIVVNLLLFVNSFMVFPK